MSRGSQRGGLGGLPTPLVVPCAGIMCRTLILLPAPQKWQLGFWSFCILLFINLPQPCMHTVISSPLEFLCILLLKEEMSVQVQALQQSVPGLRSQPVSLPPPVPPQL